MREQILRHFPTRVRFNALCVWARLSSAFQEMAHISTLWALSFDDKIVLKMIFPFPGIYG